MPTSTSQKPTLSKVLTTAAPALSMLANPIRWPRPRNYLVEKFLLFFARPHYVITLFLPILTNTMQSIIDGIKNLYFSWKGEDCERIEILPQSGSDRRYFRIHHPKGSCIATYGHNVPENEAFIYFSDHFFKYNLPVPEIHALSEDKTIY